MAGKSVGDICDRIRTTFLDLARSVEHSDIEIGQCKRAIELAEQATDPEGATVEAEEALLAALRRKCEHLQASLNEGTGVISTVVTTVQKRTDEDDGIVEELDGTNTDLRERSKALKGRLEESRERTTELEKDKAKAAAAFSDVDRRLKDAKRRAAPYTTQAPQVSFDPRMATVFAGFQETKRQLVSDIEKAKARFSFYLSEGSADGAVLGFSLADLSTEEVEGLKQDVNDWIEQQSGEDLAKLEAARQELLALGWPSEFCDVTSLQEQSAYVNDLAESWKKRIETSVTTREGERAKFIRDDAKLLHWCRQERTNLEALKEPHHVQEFCASLIQNIGTLDDSFNFLVQKAQLLLPSREIAKALVEVNEVWLNLQLHAYERQMHIMLEIHQRSKLEDEVRAFAGFPQKVDGWLDSVKQTLEIPEDSVSKSVVREPLEECKSLKRELEKFGGFGDRVHEFSTRMESLRDNYATLRRSVLSKLTFVTNDKRTVSDLAEQRKREFVERCDELRDWVKQQSEGTSWQQLNEQFKSVCQSLEDGLGEKKEEAIPQPEVPADDADEQF